MRPLLSINRTNMILAVLMTSIDMNAQDSKDYSKSYPWRLIRCRTSSHNYFTHAVVWYKPCIYADVIQSYVSHLQRHFPNHLVIVVFVGYCAKLSIKVVEKSTRTSKAISADIDSSPQINTSTTQAEYLGNGAIKPSLSSLLRQSWMLLAFLPVKQKTMLIMLSSAQLLSTANSWCLQNTDVRSHRLSQSY